jgi:oligopeptidase B
LRLRPQAHHCLVLRCHGVQIRQLCPYQTAPAAASLPPVLLTCSQQDLRVPFWGPLKYAARLRAAAAAAGSAQQPCSGAAAASRRGPILLLPDGQAGHFVHERDLLHTSARQYAFLVGEVEGEQALRGGPLP